MAVTSRKSATAFKVIILTFFGFAFYNLTRFIIQDKVSSIIINIFPDKFALDYFDIIRSVFYVISFAIGYLLTRLAIKLISKICSSSIQASEALYRFTLFLIGVVILARYTYVLDDFIFYIKILDVYQTLDIFNLIVAAILIIKYKPTFNVDRISTPSALQNTVTFIKTIFLSFLGYTLYNFTSELITSIFSKPHCDCIDREVLYRDFLEYLPYPIFALAGLIVACVMIKLLCYKQKNLYQFTLFIIGSMLIVINTYFILTEVDLNFTLWNIYSNCYNYLMKFLNIPMGFILIGLSKGSIKNVLDSTRLSPDSSPDIPPDATQSVSQN